MYITFSLYRSKNKEKFKTEKIEYVLENDEDLIELDDRLTLLLTKHICNCPEVIKYGSAYIGFETIDLIELSDNDYRGSLTQDAFITYVQEVFPGKTIIFSQNKK